MSESSQGLPKDTFRPPSQRVRFEVVLEDRDEPGDSPAVVRLRMLLKRLLRQGGFRCLSGRQLPDGQADDGPPPARAGEGGDER
jgi:hypothetical protein